MPAIILNSSPDRWPGCLLKQFEPLATYFRIKGAAKASYVSARLRKAADETISDRVGHDCKYNRNPTVVPLESRCRASAVGKNDVRSERDELAPFHSITSSARERSVGGTSRPSAFAVLRLITSSNLVGC